jgi:histidinol-phosphatase (PHP family)
MLVDLHSHTVLCNHATGDMREYVERAIERGISEFGFSEHSPWMLQEAEKLAPDFEEIPTYLERVEALQEEYNGRTNPRVHVLLGFEMDFLPDKIALARQYAQRIPFDYIIGSVHHIGRWGFDQESQLALYQKRDIRDIYEEYFQLVEQMIASGIFDIVGHIDLVKRYGYRPKGGYRDHKENMARLLSRSTMVVEVNTSGWDRPAGEPYPDLEFLRILRQHQVPVTLGSDAHAPEEVGRHFGEARELLLAAGYTHITTFRQRKPTQVKI